MKHLALFSLLSAFCLVSSHTLAASTYQSTTNVSSSEGSASDSDAKYQLTEQEKSLARQWQLEDSDWVKYKKLMDGPRGTWSPGLDPLTALGVMEEDPEERRRYAEIWTKVEARRVELELAFEVERMAFAKTYFAGQKAMNNDYLIAQWNAKQQRKDTIAMLFVDPNCMKSCESLFSQLYASVSANARLDIYFAEGTTAQEIGQWASHMKIDPQEVKNKNITLNFDDGKSREMDIKQGALPQVRVLDLDSGEIRSAFQNFNVGKNK